MERCGASPPFTLKSSNTAAGDNPFLCADLVLIQSNSRVESCVNTNIWRSRISNRGEERIWRERIKRRGEEMFFLRTCVTAQRECVSSARWRNPGDHIYFWSRHKHTWLGKNSLIGAAMSRVSVAVAQGGV